MKAKKKNGRKWTAAQKAVQSRKLRATFAAKKKASASKAMNKMMEHSVNELARHISLTPSNGDALTIDGKTLGDILRESVRDRLAVIGPDIIAEEVQNALKG